jgi:hypothetical protein
MSGNKHYEAQRRSETSKIQSARAYSQTSGTEFVGREYRGSQGRMSPETLGSESASQISQPRLNPLDRREDADRPVSNNHSFSDSDGSVGRNQHWALCELNPLDVERGPSNCGPACMSGFPRPASRFVAPFVVVIFHQCPPCL